MGLADWATSSHKMILYARPQGVVIHFFHKYLPLKALAYFTGILICSLILLDLCIRFLCLALLLSVSGANIPFKGHQYAGFLFPCGFFYKALRYWCSGWWGALCILPSPGSPCPFQNCNSLSHPHDNPFIQLAFIPPRWVLQVIWCLFSSL